MQYYLRLLVMFLIVALAIPQSTPVFVQYPVTLISIESQDLVPIEVHPGSTGIKLNPTLYQEKVDIMVNSSNLAYSTPGLPNISPGEDIGFQVTYRADQNMLMQTITSIVSAQVV